MFVKKTDPLWTGLVVHETGVMTEWLQMFRRGETSEKSAAPVAAGNRGNPFVKEPIHQGKQGETQSVCHRNEEGTGGQDQTTETLIEILGKIELATLTEGTAVKKGIDSLNLPRLHGAGGAGNHPFFYLNLAQPLAVNASEHNRPFHSQTPYLRA